MLKNKKVIITGAGSGIGRAAALHCLDLGAQVGLLDISEDKCQETLAEANHKDQARFFQCDVANKSAVEDAVKSAADWMDGVTGLVSSAGVVRHKESIALTEDDFGFVLGINFLGSVFANQAVFPFLKEAGEGSIINLGSFAGMRPAPNNAAYSASKGAIAAWTRSIAAEWGPLNIRVNALAPVAITPMSMSDNPTLQGMSQEEFLEMFAQHAPLRRIGDPLKDIAPTIAFLLSDASGFVTGQVISADGGLAMVGS